MERTLGRAATSPTPDRRRQDSPEPGPQLSRESGENLLAFFQVLTEWAATADVRATAAGASPEPSQVPQ
jgi:hypothetical protein